MLGKHGGDVRAFVVLVCVGGVVVFGGCGDNAMRQTNDVKKPQHAVELTETSELEGRTIFFQHESVGNNILDGIRDLARHNSKVNVVISEDTSLNPGPGVLLLHGRLGRNGDAIAKMDNFRSILERGTGNRVDIALVKLCYLDVTATTDIERLAKHYTEAMDELQRKFPRITFIHVTVPLTVSETTWRTRVKVAIGRERIWEYQDNVARGKYNQWIRREFSGRAPVFDLASIESVREGGVRTTFTYGDREYESLAPEYTFDGGHLNEKGRRLVAQELLKFLATVVSDRSS